MRVTGDGFKRCSATRGRSGLGRSLAAAACFVLVCVIPPRAERCVWQLPPEVELPVTVVVPPQAQPPEVTVVVRSADGYERTTVFSAGVARGVVRAAGSPPFGLEAHCSGLWSPERSLPASPPVPVQLQLWPAATVSMEVRAPSLALPPAETSIALTALREGLEQQPVEAEVRCRAHEGKVKRCVVPAGAWHLRIQAAGLAPQYLWDVGLAPGSETDLGTIVLRTGATVVGRVEAASPGDALPAATVVVVPARDLAQVAPEERRVWSAAARRTSVSPSGQFAISGLEAGAWLVSADHPECPSGHIAVTVDTRFGVVELDRPMRLRCPAAVDVRVLPASVVPEAGLPLALYAVSLHGVADEAAAEGIVPPAGTWRSPPLASGTYLLTLSDVSGSTLASRELVIDGEDVELEIELRFVPVVGRLILGRKGLPGRIEFRSEHGASVSTEADGDGDFAAVFPHPGRWRPTVMWDWPTKHLMLPSIDVAAGKELIIRLPNTRLSGVVLHADGTTPAPSAVVTLQHTQGLLGGYATATTDRHGRFNVAGFEAGRHTVTARIEGHTSRPVQVNLDEGRHTDVVLVLEGERSMRCRVRAAGTAVAQAQVLGFPADAAGRNLVGFDLPMGFTGPDGVVVLRTPSGTEKVRIVALAPGFALHETPLLPFPGAGEHLEITLSQDGGSVHVPATFFDLDGQARMLLRDGVPLLSSPLLGSWAAMHGKTPLAGQEMEIPMLPPGRWRLCQLQYAEAMLVFDGMAAVKASACSSEGLLPPGGVLRLAVPTN